MKRFQEILRDMFGSGIFDQDAKDIEGFFAKAEERKEILPDLAAELSSADITYLINGVCLVIINNTYLASLSELDHLAVFDVDNVLYGQRDLDTVPIVVRPEYYFL
jgi:hypothetical protein